MKKTLELEDDVAAKLDRLAEATGLSIDKVLNEVVREGLTKVGHELPVKAKQFTQKTHKMGWYPGMTWEKIQEMLLQDEAQEYRRSEDNK